MVSQLKEKARSLEDLLRISRHTIATLQDKLQDLQKSYQQNLSAMEHKLKDVANARMTPDALVEIINQSSASTAEKKETLLRTYERIQAQERLEGVDKKSVNSILSVRFWRLHFGGWRNYFVTYIPCVVLVEALEHPRGRSISHRTISGVQVGTGTAIWTKQPSQWIYYTRNCP
jgi:hypothetical protein